MNDLCLASLLCGSGESGRAEISLAGLPGDSDRSTSDHSRCNHFRSTIATEPPTRCSTCLSLAGPHTSRHSSQASQSSPRRNNPAHQTTLSGIRQTLYMSTPTIMPCGDGGGGGVGGRPSSAQLLRDRYGLVAGDGPVAGDQGQGGKGQWSGGQGGSGRGGKGPQCKWVNRGTGHVQAT